MKLLCLLNIFSNILFSQSIAFYYGKDFNDPRSKIFDKLVVQPQNIPKEILKENPERYYAYISIFEFNEETLKRFAISYRQDWKTYIADIRDKLWQEHLLQKIKDLKKDGFINFFFDNIDSYKLISKTPQEEEEFKNALIDFLERFKKENPESDLILNRPLELLDKTLKYSSKIAVESLYSTFDPINKTYTRTSEQETKYLSEILKNAKNMGYKVYVIDYEKDKTKRVEIARMIKEEGFEPYVSDYMLEEWGSNEFEKVPREVILLYDSKVYPDKVFSSAHQLFSLPIEYIGYVAKIRDINEGLPKIDENTQAVILIADAIPNISEFKRWIVELMGRKIKLIFLGDAIFKSDKEILNLLKIKTQKNLSNSKEPFEIVQREECSFFEANPGYINTDLLVFPENAKPIITFKNQSNQIHIPAAITTWGGYIKDEVLIKEIFGYNLLVINPFCFFRKIFRDIPVLDLTTENGSRILFIHLDGDGFTSLYENSPEKLYAAEVFLKEILYKYKIPHSVSIIRGEITNPKLSEDEKKRFINIAKEIFNLPYVEPANHSYSHPYKWIQLKDTDNFAHIEQIYNIDIPNYKFDILEETINTNKWIEENLLRNKKVELFFWTGDCIAPSKVLKILYDNNILNINGGITSATKTKPFLHLISPSGIERDGFYQIYAAQTNENIYTNLWRFPFWGFERILETQDITDKPLRLKPINIYYHFYSLSKYDSLNALKKVYDKSLEKEIILKFTSEYIRTVLDFYKSQMFNYKDNWLIVSDGFIKTIRLKDTYAEINENVCGYRKINSENYFSLCSSPPYKIKLTSQLSKTPYIEKSNAKVESFQKVSNGYKIVLKGYIPIRYSLKNAGGYKIFEKDYKDGISYVKEIRLQK